jgi:hypothetical protein
MLCIVHDVIVLSYSSFLTWPRVPCTFHLFKAPSNWPPFLQFASLQYSLYSTARVVFLKHKPGHAPLLLTAASFPSPHQGLQAPASLLTQQPRQIPLSLMHHGSPAPGQRSSCPCAGIFPCFLASLLLISQVLA